MNEENSEEVVVCAHEITVRFEQMEDGRVRYTVVPDDTIWRTRELSLVDMAEADAPLSAMGIRALWKLCVDGMMVSALNLASMVRGEIGKRVVGDSTRKQIFEAPESVTIN